MNNHDTSELLSRLKFAGKNLTIFESVIILNPEVVTIGDGTRIDDYVKLEGGLGLTLDHHIHIASFSSILGGGSARLGAFTGLAQGARVVTGGGHPFADRFPSPPPPGDPFTRQRLHVELGAYSFVGANAVVLPGVTVGEGGVIAAGSVATKDVPAWTIVAGSPARPVRSRAPIIPD